MVVGINRLKRNKVFLFLHPYMEWIFIASSNNYLLPIIWNIDVGMTTRSVRSHNHWVDNCLNIMSMSLWLKLVKGYWSLEMICSHIKSIYMLRFCPPRASLYTISFVAFVCISLRWARMHEQTSWDPLDAIPSCHICIQLSSHEFLGCRSTTAAYSIQHL